MAIDSTTRRKYTSRWAGIQTKLHSLGLEYAILAHEVRAEFPTGKSGNMQFRIWIAEHLDITGHGALRFLIAGAVYGKYGDDLWDVMADWAAIRYFFGLPYGKRRAILTSIRTQYRKYGKPVTLTSVRTISFDHGVKPGLRGGRPTRTASEERLAALRAWVNKLYNTFDNLPSLPANVKSALDGTVLNKIIEDATA